MTKETMIGNKLEKLVQPANTINSLVTAMANAYTMHTKRISAYDNLFALARIYQNAFTAIDSYSTNLQKLIDKFNFKHYDFADLIENFEDEDVKTPKQDSAKNIIIGTSSKIKDILFDIYLNNENLYKISPREFEKVIAELLYHNGFEVELTKQTRDHGFDIIALKHMDNLSPIKYLVECKRYSPKNKIGVEMIRSFKEVIWTEQANKGLFVTTSYFSIDAIKKRKEMPYLLDYKDKDEIINWVNEYYKTKISCQ